MVERPHRPRVNFHSRIGRNGIRERTRFKGSQATAHEHARQRGAWVHHRVRRPLLLRGFNDRLSTSDNETKDLPRNSTLPWRRRSRGFEGESVEESPPRRDRVGERGGNCEDNLSCLDLSCWCLDDNPPEHLGMIRVYMSLMYNCPTYTSITIMKPKVAIYVIPKWLRGITCRI